MQEKNYKLRSIAMNPAVRALKGQVFEHSLEEFVNVTRTDEVTSLINQIRAHPDFSVAPPSDRHSHT